MLKQELIMLQSLPLDVKIAKSKLRIREFVDALGEENVYISFSGGKDSLVLLHMIRSEYPNIEAVYVDTGLEYPEIKEFVKTFENVTILRPKKTFKQVLEQYGYPVVSKEQAGFIEEYRNTKSEKLRDLRLNGDHKGRFKISAKWRYLIDAPFEISAKCCNIMKKYPAKKYEKETGKAPFIGTMACESVQRLQVYLRTGCNAFDLSRVKSTPIGFWTEQDVLEYILKFDLRLPSPYGDIIKDENNKLKTTKCDRTGCVWCLFGINAEKGENRIQRLQRTHPHLHDYCLNKLGVKEVLEYMNIQHSLKEE